MSPSAVSTRARRLQDYERRWARHHSSRHLRAEQKITIIEHVSSSSAYERELARGAYGAEHVLRPAEGGRPGPHCLRGHDLAIAGAPRGWSHRYQRETLTCQACSALHDPLGTWVLVDPGRQHLAADVPSAGLALVRIPPEPDRRGGVGQLQLRIDATVRADLDLTMCGPCRRAVIEHIRVDDAYRRQGYGRVLVAAALAQAPPDRYRWSTTRIADDPIARAFWTTVGFPHPDGLGTPDYCTDQQRAAGLIPD